MSSQKPTSFSRCTDRINQRNYALHRTRLATVKSSIDREPPKLYSHLYQKLKKAQLEEERCAMIERDNRTLVKRMTEVMRRPGLDQSKPASIAGSLNHVRRKQELERITSQNHALLRRIQERPPTYNHLHWEQDREVNEALCERICKYSYRPAGGSVRQPQPLLEPGESGTTLPAITQGKNKAAAADQQ